MCDIHGAMHGSFSGEFAAEKCVSESRNEWCGSVSKEREWRLVRKNQRRVKSIESEMELKAHECVIVENSRMRDYEAQRQCIFSEENDTWTEEKSVCVRRHAHAYANVRMLSG